MRVCVRVRANVRATRQHVPPYQDLHTPKGKTLHYYVKRNI